MKKTLILAILYTIYISETVAQVKVDNQDMRLFFTNTIFGGITTGVGALINKEKDKKPLPTFLNGFKYGCIGGALLFTGKKCTNLIYQDKLVAGGWGGKLIHNAGLSLMENVSVHRPPFSHYNLYVGFFRIEIDWDEKVHLAPKVMPISAGGFLYSMIELDAKVDIKKSIQLGSIYLSSDTEPLGFQGLTIKNSMTIYEKHPHGENYTNHITAHEHIHILQGQEYFIFNTYLIKNLSALKTKKSTINMLSKFVYFDFSTLDIVYPIAKGINDQTSHCYWSNPFEFEAEKMAINRYLDLNLYCD